MRHTIQIAAAFVALIGGCDGDKTPADSDRAWACVLDASQTHDYSPELGCREDFDLLASAPLDASIPGARSSKTVIDRVADNTLYFTNSNTYPIHYDFASAQLSGNGLPIVPDLGTFNATEYYSPDRRFILGAVTWYEEPGVFVYEIAPYDTASVDMIVTAYRAIVANSYVGAELLFHPTSQAVEALVPQLPEDVAVITTGELFAGITYQPLNLGTAMGQLAFYEAADSEFFVNYREIVVLDEIPNDISVVAGTITGEFQTPLAHINVLAQNRGTPNMGLTGAFTNETLRALEGQWVELTVGALEWTIREVTQAEADAWWEGRRPEPLEVTPMDTSVTGVWDCFDIIDQEIPLGEAISARVPVFGGKATNMSAMTHIGAAVPVPACLAVPVHYYNQHMVDHGLWDRYDELTQDPDWGDPQHRAELLEGFMEEIRAAPIDPAFIALVVDKVGDRFLGAKARFRSSTNAEDLGNFTGAGLYTSQSGEWSSDGADIAEAIGTVWASVWGPRAWEEREYWGIDHVKVGMAMLVNPTFQDELANGVAITGNVFDTAGIEPAFYINVQQGEASVVIPENGTTTDQLLYYYNLPGRPIVYIAHSNQVAEGETVLSSAQLYELGVALDAIHLYFYEAYGTGGGFYAMDTEFKFTESGALSMKQARPYPGWSSGE